MTLYNVLLIVSSIVLCFVLWNIVKNKMNIGYAMIWILWGITMILISLFPGIVIRLSSLLGINVPSNAVFLITIFFLYCLTFYVYSIMSKLKENIVNLNYEIANLKKKIEESERENENKD